MKINKRQKDAIAKNLDNIGTALFIAMMAGIFVDSKLTLLNGIAMGIFTLHCFGIAAFLRRGDD